MGEEGGEGGTDAALRGEEDQRAKEQPRQGERRCARLRFGLGRDAEAGYAAGNQSARLVGSRPTDAARGSDNNCVYAVVQWRGLRRPMHAGILRALLKGRAL